MTTIVIQIHCYSNMSRLKQKNLSFQKPIRFCLVYQRNLVSVSVAIMGMLTVRLMRLTTHTRQIHGFEILVWLSSKRNRG